MTPDPQPVLLGDSSSLVLAASRGDDFAIEALLERHLPALRTFVRLRSGRLIRAKESCSDIAQSVCRDLLKDLHEFHYEGEGAFRNWLYTAALRKIGARARYYRAEKRDAARELSRDAEVSKCYLSFQTPSCGVMDREGIERIEAAFEKLPDDYRDVILRAKISGLSNSEIAKDLDRSVAAVSTLLFRALARLAFLLDSNSSE